jgi:hypothetical protein
MVDKVEIALKAMEKRQASIDKAIDDLRASLAKGPGDGLLKKIGEVEKRVVAIEAALKAILAKQEEKIQEKVLKEAKKMESEYMKVAEKVILDGRLKILEGHVNSLLATRR